MTNLRKQKGFSLIEMLITVAIVGIASVITYTILGASTQTWSQSVTLASVRTVQQSLVAAIDDTMPVVVYPAAVPYGQAMANTITAGSTGGNYSSGNMSCLKNGTACVDGLGIPLSSQNFALFDHNNNLLFDSTNPKAGFTNQGAACNAYSAAGNDACPFRYNLQWKANCAVDGNCVNPQIQISGTLSYSPKSKSLLAFNTSDYDVGHGTGVNDLYQIPPIQTSPCSKPFVPFATQIGGGVQTNGSFVIHTACNTWTAGTNSISGATTNMIEDANEFGSGGPATSVILTNLDSHGNVVWVSEYGMPNTVANVTGMIQDSTGNSFVAGYVTCTGSPCSFGGTIHGTDGLPNNSNAFIIMFDSNGNLKWVTQLGGGTINWGGPMAVFNSIPSITANAIAIDLHENLYIVGGAYNSLNGSAQQAPAIGVMQAYVAKFSSTGVFGWVSQVGYGEYQATNPPILIGYKATGVTVDGSGNIDISGTANGGLQVNQISTTAHGNNDLFAAQFKSIGSMNWSLQVGVPGDIWAQSVQTDVSGNLYVAGMTDALLDSALTPFGVSVQRSGHGVQDVYLMKIANTGSLLWASQYGATGAAMNLSQQGGAGLGADGAGNFYMLGLANTFLGGICFNNCFGTSTFLSKISSSGAFSSPTQLGPLASPNSPPSLFVSVAGDAYVTATVNNMVGSLYGVHAIDALVTTFDSGGNSPFFTKSTPAVYVPTWPIQMGEMTTTSLTSPNSTPGTGSGVAVVQDSVGDSIVVGTTNLVLGGAMIGVHGTDDFFISEFDVNGNLKWTDQLGASAKTTEGSGISTDGTSFYAVGDTTSVSVNPGSVPGSFIGNHGIQDLIVTKFDASGNTLWISQLGQKTSGSKAAANLTIAGSTTDGSGNTYIVGSTNAQLDPGQLSPTTLFGNSGTEDVILAKFSSAGTLDWIQELGNTGAKAFGMAVALDSSTGPTYVYVTGSTTGGLPTTSAGAANSMNGSQDAFVAQFSASSGEFNWCRQYGAATGTSRGNGIAVDASGNVVFSGSTNKKLPGNQYGFFTSGDYTLLVGSATATGALNWINQIGAWVPCTGGEACVGMVGASLYGEGVTIGADGNYYAVGYTSGSIPNATQYGSHGSNDAVVAELGSTGNLIQVSELGSQANGELSPPAASLGNTYALGITSSHITGVNAIIAGFTDAHYMGKQYGVHQGPNANFGHDFILFRSVANDQLP